MNSIGAEFSHMVTNTFIIFIYAVINYLYTKLKGEYVYPVLTWDSTEAWLAAAGLVIIAIFL